MLSKSFKIVEPKRFDLYIEDINCSNTEAIVKIENAAVCKADIRYYLGKRDERTLGLKYPMNLLHEAVGTIIEDKSGKFKVGTKVTLVPNLILNRCDKECIHKVCNKKELGENYCPHAKFASSNYNGFSKEFVSYPVTNIIKIPQSLDLSVMVFSELISVACSAYRRVELKGDETIGIWGDGVLGYILSSVFKFLHPNGKIIAVGKHKDKLLKFSCYKTFLSGDHEIRNSFIDVGFECVGGNFTGSAINEIINSIKIGGKIILTGVSENEVEINTRKILEKGLSFYGVTRSNVDDFKLAIELFNNELFYSNIKKMILSENRVTNIVDFYKVFEMECENKQLGKNIMKFLF